MFDFKDHVVIVTGATGNLGASAARGFLASGARLVLPARGSGRLAAAFPELAGAPDHYLAEEVDLTGEESVAALVDETMRRFGRIDVLVNAAGGFLPGKAVHETTLAEWDAAMDLNLRTTLVMARAVIPCMLEQGSGAIINVAGGAGLAGKARRAAQSAAKSSVMRLTESMAEELKAQGIRVNCVLPGTMDTPENRRDMPKADTSRWVSTEAVSDVIQFLASPAARGIHGVSIPVMGLGG